MYILENNLIFYYISRVSTFESLNNSFISAFSLLFNGLSINYKKIQEKYYTTQIKVIH